MSEELRLERAEHVHYLENESVEIGGIRFLGCTLWTDFRLFGDARQAEVMTEASKSMNDYANISIGWGKGTRKLLPTDTLALHLESRAWLEQELAKPYPAPTVVVKHHAPIAFHLLLRMSRA